MGMSVCEWMEDVVDEALSESYGQGEMECSIVGIADL